LNPLEVVLFFLCLAVAAVRKRLKW
jgi:hypothetical protein